MLRRLAAVVVLTAAGCSDDPDANRLARAESDGRAVLLVGDTITVSGRVARVVAPDAFLLDGEDISLGSDEGTLILGGDVEVAEGGVVRVTGTVEPFVAATAGTTFGVEVDGDDPLVVAYEEEYAIDARTVDLVPAAVLEGDDPERFEDALRDGTADQLVGQTVAVGGRVVEQFGPHAVRVKSDDDGLGPILITVEPIEMENPEFVHAVGTVEVFLLRDLEPRYGIDLDDGALGRLGYDYVVVADRVAAIPEQR